MTGCALKGYALKGYAKVLLKAIARYKIGGY